MCSLRTQRRGVAALAVLLVWAIVAPVPAIRAAVDEARFKDYEIRVIRPRYFNKQGRFEIGTQLTAIMNQTFIYSYMATGIISFHFVEALGIEAGVSYGFSVDKEDKAKLKGTYDIKTQILRTKSIFDLALLYTPMYGKYQLTSGRLIYFDTFLSLGGGLTGVEYKYDHCIDPFEEISDDGVRAKYLAANGPKPEPRTVSYPTFLVGLGQRIFLSKSFGLRWDVRDHVFPYSLADGACTASGAEGSELHNNVTLQLGASKFF